MSKFYFAYGSNMNLGQMRKRCHGATFITKAKLFGYKFVYDGNSITSRGAVANIVESTGDIVEGAIFEIDDKCEKALDWYEGFPTAYQKKNIECIGDDGNIYHAFAYLRAPLKIGKPSENYKNVVLEGARDVGLSEKYIREFIENE
ncbi:MAG: gamma-glutamylcyclotransferase family protein [Candidatus Micrarchaeia archaeon]